jgi:hypothetical protein
MFMIKLYENSPYTYTRMRAHFPSHTYAHATQNLIFIKNKILNDYIIVSFNTRLCF